MFINGCFVFKNVEKRAHCLKENPNLKLWPSHSHFILYVLRLKLPTFLLCFKSSLMKTHTEFTLTNSFYQTNFKCHIGLDHQGERSCKRFILVMSFRLSAHVHAWGKRTERICLLCNTAVTHSSSRLKTLEPLHHPKIRRARHYVTTADKHCLFFYFFGYSQQPQNCKIFWPGEGLTVSPWCHRWELTSVT